MTRDEIIKELKRINQISLVLDGTICTDALEKARQLNQLIVTIDDLDYEKEKRAALVNAIGELIDAHA